MNAEPQNLAPPVDNDRLASYFRDVESFQAERKRSAKRSARVAWIVAGVSLAGNLALAVAIDSMLPLERLVPAFITVHSDGTVSTTMNFSALPRSEQKAAIRAAVWKYVRDRESYDFADAQYRYDATSLMSASTVRNRYQNWFLAKGQNSTSPQVTIGRKGQINVSMVAMSFVRKHVALVRFKRTKLMYGSTPESTTWTATVQFQLAQTLPASARLSDPSGLVVTSYQASRDTP